VIPSEQVNKLIRRLKQEKLQLFNYVYSGKAKLLWDLAIFLLLFLVTALCYERSESGAQGINHLSSLSKAVFRTFAGLFAAGTLSSLAKTLVDARHWSVKLSRLVEYAKR
jgi:hypothetical protein